LNVLGTNTGRGAAIRQGLALSGWLLVWGTQGRCVCKRARAKKLKEPIAKANGVGTCFVSARARMLKRGRGNERRVDVDWMERRRYAR
jgi:hypothetical protein